MNKLRAEERTAVPGAVDAADQMLWRVVQAALEREGWAAALVSVSGCLRDCNGLFRRRWNALKGSAALLPGITLSWLEMPGAVERWPAELKHWQSQMLRIALRFPLGGPHLQNPPPGSEVHEQSRSSQERPRLDSSHQDSSQDFICLRLPAPSDCLLMFAAESAPSLQPMALLGQAVDQSGVAAMVTDPSARIVYVNQRFSEITGYTSELIVGQNPRILQSDRTPSKVYHEMWSRLNASESWEGRVLNRRFNGEHFWSFQTISPIYDQDNKLSGYLSLSHDSEAIHEDYLSLHHMAYYDSLCGIANRRALQSHLNSLLEAADYHNGQRIVLLFLNLDNFKLINDGYGHEAGDTVLQAVCNRIVQRNYLKGFLARLGGDEFALVVHGKITESSIVDFADALLAEVTRPIEVDGHNISVSASVGVALAPTHAGQSSRLMKCADTATQAAKSAGRNRSVVFKQSMLQTGDTRIAERGVLTRALELDELFPVFQPVIYCNERGVAYYEALVRWQHPELGPLAPVTFLPAFQQFGLLTKLNSWMLDHACMELARLGPGTCMSLNIAAPDLMLDDYADRVLARLRFHGVEPTRIRLEITEGELIENFAACERSIARLRAAGTRFYIDDFGVGYASLAYLKRLPVDGIKLDRSFLQDFPIDNQAVDIIASVIGLAHRLGLEVTAEGVESMEQARLLSELGCDYLQGFLFGKPGLTEGLPQRYL